MLAIASDGSRHQVGSTVTRSAPPSPGRLHRHQVGSTVTTNSTCATSMAVEQPGPGTDAH